MIMMTMMMTMMTTTTTTTATTMMMMIMMMEGAGGRLSFTDGPWGLLDLDHQQSLGRFALSITNDDDLPPSFHG